MLQLKIISLALLCFGHVILLPVKHVRMKYKLGDWRPHFGYHPSHYGADHSRFGRSIKNQEAP